MKIVYSDKHAQHDPQHFVVRGTKLRSAEQPERAIRLLAAATEGGHTILPPKSYGPAPAATVHTPDYLDFLQMPPVQTGVTMTAEALEQSAGLLESVLEDFGIKGEVIDVRPGPVVTLYEFEPAPGVKSSRVIGLADDIARSMSAIAARVAVVPGRNAIELAETLRQLEVDEEWIHEIVRRKALFDQEMFTHRAMAEPDAVKAFAESLK